MLLRPRTSPPLTEKVPTIIVFAQTVNQNAGLREMSAQTGMKKGHPTQRELTALLRARDELIHSPPAVPLDGTIPFSQGFALSVPHGPGIYLFHDLRGVFYAGKSEDLRRRFDEHFFERANPLLAAAIHKPVGETKFSWREVGVQEMDALERRLIRAFHPLCNRRLYYSN